MRSQPKTGYPTQHDMFDALAVHYWAGKEWSAEEMAKIIARMEADYSTTNEESTDQTESEGQSTDGTDEIDWDAHLGADQSPPYAWNGWNYRD